MSALEVPLDLLGVNTKKMYRLWLWPSTCSPGSKSWRLQNLAKRQGSKERQGGHTSFNLKNNITGSLSSDINYNSTEQAANSNNVKTR